MFVTYTVTPRQRQVNMSFLWAYKISHSAYAARVGGESVSDWALTPRHIRSFVRLPGSAVLQETPEVTTPTGTGVTGALIAVRFQRIALEECVVLGLFAVIFADATYSRIRPSPNIFFREIRSEIFNRDRCITYDAASSPRKYLLPAELPERSPRRECGVRCHSSSRLSRANCDGGVLTVQSLSGCIAFS